MNGPARPIDHLVLPVASLAAARARLSDLGFTVAPDGEHPFGTANCCVYLADGTFLEPLVSRDAKKVAAAISMSNVFVSRHEAFRFRRGEEGFSAVVFGSPDAAADHAAFAGSGWSGGPLLEFSRAFVDASGNEDEASFRLAFAADMRAPDCLFFTCERVHAPNVDRSALQMHANGVVGLKSIVLTAPRAAAFKDFVEAASGAGHSEGRRDGTIVLHAANADLVLADSQKFAAEFGALCGDEDRGLQARMAVFEVDDLGRTTAYLSSRQIEHVETASGVVVPPRSGQGAIFAFEASQ